MSWVKSVKTKDGPTVLQGLQKLRHKENATKPAPSLHPYSKHHHYYHHPPPKAEEAVQPSPSVTEPVVVSKPRRIRLVTEYEHHGPGAEPTGRDIEVDIDEEKRQQAAMAAWYNSKEYLESQPISHAPGF